MRAVAFGAMAMATFHLPLLSRLPPFITLSDLFAAASLGCLVRADRRDEIIARGLGVLAGAAVAASSIYGIWIAYQAKSVVGLLIFSAGILFSGGGTVLVLVRGPWPREQTARR